MADCLEYRNSKAENISRRQIPLTANDFGRKEMRCSDKNIASVESISINAERFHQTVVNDPAPSRLIHHQVVRLDITVQQLI